MLLLLILIFRFQNIQRQIRTKLRQQAFTNLNVTYWHRKKSNKSKLQYLSPTKC